MPVQKNDPRRESGDLRAILTGNAQIMWLTQPDDEPASETSSRGPLCLCSKLMQRDFRAFDCASAENGSNNGLLLIELSAVANIEMNCADEMYFTFGFTKHPAL